MTEESGEGKHSAPEQAPDLMLMDEGTIKTRLLAAKDKLFQGARAVREKDEPVFPLVGALMPNGQFIVQSMGPVPEPMIQAVLERASDNIKAVGAVGALVLADSEFVPETPDVGMSERSLVCYLVMPNWSEAWFWVYRESEEGWAWEEHPTAVSRPDHNIAFAPFPQIAVDRGHCH